MRPTDRLVAAVLASAIAVSVAVALVLPSDPLPAGSGTRWTEVYRNWRDPVRGETYAYDAVVIGKLSRRYDGTPQSLPTNLAFELVGWAYDPMTRRSSTGFGFRIDGGVWQGAWYHIPRPDVAAAFHAPDFTGSGFIVRLPAGSLAPGEHTLELATLEGSEPTILPDAVALNVTAR